MSLNHARDSGLDFEDAQGILDALEAHQSAGVLNVGMDLQGRAQEPKRGPQSLKGIDSIYHREFVYEGARLVGVRLRKFFMLGEGKLVTTTDLRSLWGGYGAHGCR